MRGYVLLILLFAGTLAAGQDEWTFSKDPYKVRALEFEVSVPEGWTRRQDSAGMVAFDAKRNGFQVSREPFLQDEKTFARFWTAQLETAEKTTRVEEKKAGRHTAWRAAWVDDQRKRQIEIWRVYAPENEMLYNFSFSAEKGVDLGPLVAGVLKSFKCTAPKAELKFQQQTEAVNPRIQLRLPVGYEKAQGRGFGLGGGLSGEYYRTITGYAEPHVAGWLRFQEYKAGQRYGRESGAVITGSDTKGMLEDSWVTDQAKLGEVLKSGKPRSARFGGLKGHSLEAQAKTKKGVLKRWLGFCGKHKQTSIEIIIVVDEREARLYDDYLKLVCSNLEIAK